MILTCDTPINWFRNFYYNDCDAYSCPSETTIYIIHSILYIITIAWPTSVGDIYVYNIQ